MVKVSRVGRRRPCKGEKKLENRKLKRMNEEIRVWRFYIYVWIWTLGPKKKLGRTCFDPNNIKIIIIIIRDVLFVPPAFTQASPEFIKISHSLYSQRATFASWTASVKKIGPFYTPFEIIHPQGRSLKNNIRIVESELSSYISEICFSFPPFEQFLKNEKTLQ
jgi:hypothetical protein